MTKFSRWAALALGLIGVSAALGFYEPPLEAEQRQVLQKTMEAGNYKDAYEGFRRLALDDDTDPKQVGTDLTNAIQCLRRLHRVDEIDAFREAVIDGHADNWRLLKAAAQSYLDGTHYGYLIAGEFQRGRHRGGGEAVNVPDRDRVRALQLLRQATPLVKESASPQEAGEFYFALAQALLAYRSGDMAWRLQTPTNLAELPDYEPGWGYDRNAAAGAAVDAEGNPIYYHAPESWETAKNDGERRRWALEQAVEADAGRLNRVRLERANFLRSQFGVQTMAYYGRFFATRAAEDAEKDESGTYALHTLGENETIAKLATGIKRFKLPDEFNFIRLYQQILDDDKTGYGDSASHELAGLFEDRRQYPKAADYWRESIKKYGDPMRRKRAQLEQIVGNWGRFEPTATRPAGRGTTLEYRFRNGEQVAFEAHALDVHKLLADVKDYLRSNPERLEWQKINLGRIGYRIVHENQKKYVGERVAQWKMELDPADKHFDRRVTVATPLTKGGAYLVTAKMADGNVGKIVVWIADTAIVKKPLDDKAYYFVADAVTGQPVAGANLEFFGYDQKQVGPNEYRVETKSFAGKADAQGQAFQPVENDTQRYQWLVTARAPDGRFAFLGFTRVWHADYRDAEYNQTKVFTITDRPVYRPGQTVHFKFWVRKAQYDQEDKSQFAHQTFEVNIHDPKGEKIFTKQLTSDAYGGLNGQFELPEGATLGKYSLSVVNYGVGSFRVEEYKKPEFEVSVEAPDEPVALGDKITATIKANYYFGSPVVEAKVKYKVLRTSYDNRWYPLGRWDWLYGRGYWWFAYDCPWYPGWNVWGCPRPIDWWWPRRYEPPEVVAERETEIGPDGTVKVEIDTAVAQAVHPDQNHRYQIIAEVVDQSRRTIVGRGEVLVARRPFDVCVWTDCGYYHTGEVIEARFSARTLDDRPVEGPGEAVLLSIRYENNKPVETEVGKWPVNPNPEGIAKLQIKASRAGQYRLKYTLTDKAGHSVEGAYLFTIIGPNFNGAEFRFNDIELIPKNREYAPGETVKLQVNVNKPNATVLLFLRPSNGVYLPPQVVRMQGKSQVVEVPVTKKDMPNFFIEAVTVGDAQVYDTVREIYVPPAKRVLGVEVVASSHAYKPGQQAKLKLKLTGPDGKPFVGSTVLAVYDKALEYISAGSNVPEIKKFFWDWRRYHRPRGESSLDRHSPNLTLPGKPAMQNLGVFGATVPEEVGQRRDELAQQGQGQHMLHMRSGGKMQGMGGMGGGAFGPPGLEMEEAAMPAAAPMRKGAVANEPLAYADKQQAESAPDEALVQPTVRTKFADTALWKAAVATGADGLAEVELTMPENLTTWKIRAWSMGHGTQVGQGEAEVVTRKNLIVRLQAPRFFVQTDEVVLSANVHNYLDEAKTARVTLELDGPALEPLDETERSIKIPAGGEVRVDWRVKAVQEGEAVVRMKALTDEESDSMQMSFPVHVHGMLKMESFSGALRPEDELGKITVRVPSERRPEQSRLEVRYSPTLAGAMVDALPYLIDYPYGCTEQTLNRFLPAVITQNVLLDMKLDLKAIKKKRTNLNAQEIGDARERAKGWKQYDRNPVFDEAELRKVVNAGVNRLNEMQLSDGGWGWFSGWGEHSYAHTTATVVHGLQVARQNDVPLLPNMLDRGVEWLKNYQDEQVRLLENDKKDKEPSKPHADNIDALVYMVLVDAGVKNEAMQEFLYRDRTKISVYAMAMFGLALEKQNEAEKLAMIMDNIRQYLVQDDENQTAYLKLGADWWCWYGSEIEADSYYLKLLARTRPKSEIASRLVKYLLNNRKHANYWDSTRDTALAIEALAEYLQASGENKPNMTVEIWIDGEKKQEAKITAENLFAFDNKFVLEGEEVEDGVHTIELRKRGEGPLYYNAYLTNFTLEDPIAAAGLEIKIQRNYYRLVPVDKTVEVAGSRGQVVDRKVEKYRREPLANLATLESGDLVEVELVIESKNDYEYILFEDMKPAGFEPVEVRSGYTGNELGAYVEFRDNRVAMFVHTLARGKHSVSYRARAEIPGRFSALPAKVSAMYAPELKANSDELKLKIVDEK